jgi:hypothetical protein
MTRTIVLLAGLSVVLAACAAQLGGSPDTSPSPDASVRDDRTAPELPTIPPSDEPMTGEVPAEIMANLVADAAERGGVDPGDVEVVQAISITWNDGSLGCPEPNMSYTMALVDGYHVILLAGGEELDYRVNTGGGFRLCENGGRPSR